MRTRNSKEQPPREADVRRIVEHGVRPEDNQCRELLLKRLKTSCYLSKDEHASGRKALNAKERLMAQYRKDGLVLFLGAGVSIGSGIPGWNSLVEEMLRKMGFDPSGIARTFPLLISQFEAACLSSSGRRHFTENLYDCLYGQSQFKDLKRLLETIPKRRDKQSVWENWKHLHDRLALNETLRDVADLLILDEVKIQTDSASRQCPACNRPVLADMVAKPVFRRNPQIHAVLTTNADNLLELYCVAKTSGNRRRIVTMVDRASVGAHPDAIPVYHLHGVLDARDENFRRTDFPCGGEDVQEISDELLPRLVFRESEYYDTIANPASFVNHAPQSYFQRLNILFVGTSLDDLNIRRWLYSSFRERVEQRTRYLREYYCKKYEDAEYEAKLESVRHFWLRTKKEHIGGVEKEISCETAELVEKVMRELGVQVVWCEDLCDMRRCIRDLNENGRVPDFGRQTIPV